MPIPVLFSKSLLRLRLMLAVMTAAMVHAGTLGGKVLSPDGSPLAGVVVRLASNAALTTTTDATGSWSIAGVTGIGRSTPHATSHEANMKLADGHLVWSHSGVDISGRIIGRDPFTAGSMRPVVAARSWQVGPDTLIYSYHDTTFLRDTVSSGERLGMLREYDPHRNPSVIHGYLIDARDGRQYRYVTIGTQVWMADNVALNGKTGYTWSQAMALEPRFDSIAWTGDTTDHQGACPDGWHVPLRSEWNILGTGWHSALVRSGFSGADTYGFYAAAFEDFRSASIPEAYGLMSGITITNNPSLLKYHLVPGDTTVHLRCLRD